MKDYDTTTVASTTTRWQKIEIRKHPKYGNQLVINDDLQISESDRSYNVAMVCPLLSLESFPRVAILGGGDGGVLHELIETDRIYNRGLKKAIMLEIDEEVIRLSKEHLPAISNSAFDHPKAEIIIGDVLKLINSYENLDAIIYDLTIDPVREDQTRAEFLNELMQKVARSLKPGGILNMQCCGTQSYDPETGIYRKEIMTDIKNALINDFHNFLEQRVFIPSFGEAWTFLAAERKGG